MPSLDGHCAISKACFLSLPLELRYQVYGCLVAYDPMLPCHYLYSGQDRISTSVVSREGSVDTAILAVNRQIYFEALQFIYGETTWHIDIDYRDRHTTMMDIGQFSCLPGFQHLRKINLNINVMDRTPADMQPYLVVRGLTCGNVTAIPDKVEVMSWIASTLTNAPALESITISWYDVIRSGILQSQMRCLTPLSKVNVPCSVGRIFLEPQWGFLSTLYDDEKQIPRKCLEYNGTIVEEARATNQSLYPEDFLVVERDLRRCLNSIQPMDLKNN